MAIVEGEIRVGDIGTEFVVTLEDTKIINGEKVTAPVDLTGYTKLTIVFQKSDDAETVVRMNAVIFDAPTTGEIVYTTPDADFLNVSGRWKIQGFAELPEGKWHSTIDEFEVHENL